jgi:MFS family permease
MDRNNLIRKSSKSSNFLLVNRNFALLWSGQAISQIGDFVFSTTIVLWIATTLAKGQPWAPLAVSGDLLALSIPMFTIGPFAGVFVDRWNKRNTMLWMDALRATLLLVLSLATITFFVPGVRLPIFLPLGILYVIIFLASIGSLFFNPARFALLADLVSEQERPRAAGLTQLSVNVASIVGPLLASLLFFSVGVQWALLLNALSFVVSFVGIALIRVTGASEGMVPLPQGTIISEFGKGISFFFRNGLLRALVITNVIFMLSNGALGALNIFFLTHNLHTPASFYGVLETVAGIGTVLGAVIAIAFTRRVGVTRMFGLALLAIGLLMIIYARLSSFAPALVITFLLGIPNAIFLAANSPIMMHATPREFMGRVMSVFMPITSLTTVLSTAAIGYLASVMLTGFQVTLFGVLFGPLDTIFIVAGVIVIIGGAYALVKMRGIQIAGSLLRPGPVIVARPRNADGTPKDGGPSGPGPVLVRRPGGSLLPGPGPVLVEIPDNGVLLGPGPVLVEIPDNGVLLGPGPVLVEIPVDGSSDRVPPHPDEQMKTEL